MTISELIRQLHTAWLFDPKAATSAALSVVTFVTAGFIIVDLITHHLMPDRWRKAMAWLSALFIAMGIWGTIRFYDTLVDLLYLEQHPSAALTPSLSQSWLTSWPVALMALLTFGFLIALNFAYYHKAKPRE